MNVEIIGSGRFSFNTQNMNFILVSVGKALGDLFRCAGIVHGFKNGGNHNPSFFIFRHPRM